jgi:hypothetical protein
MIGIFAQPKLQGLGCRLRVTEAISKEIGLGLSSYYPNLSFSVDKKSIVIYPIVVILM